MLVPFSFARLQASTATFRTAQREGAQAHRHAHAFGHRRDWAVFDTDGGTGRRSIHHDWKIRVQPADRRPFVFKATFLRVDSVDDERALDALYAYGDGDLAVLLQDLGADDGAICGLLDRLQNRRSADIMVDVTDEAMEVLSRRLAPGAGRGNS